MGVITSPVKRFPGTITLPESYGFGEMISWDEHITRAKELDGYAQLREFMLAVLPMVSAWNIQGLPEHPTELPATPRVPVIELMTWALAEINKVINGDEDTPPFLEGGS